MSTTTVRIDDELKDRVAAAARRAGTSPHAFIVEAIARTVEQAELDEEFRRVAERRWRRVLATGKTVSWDEAAAYLEARSRGEAPRKLAASEPSARPPVADEPTRKPVREPARKAARKAPRKTARKPAR